MKVTIPKIKRIGVLIFLFVAAAVVAQTPKADSLKQLILTDKEDSNKVNHLTTLAVEYRLVSNHHEGLDACTKAVSLAKKLGYKLGEANANNNAGLIYQDEGDYPGALKSYFAALKLYEEIKNKKGIGKAYNNIGIIYDYQGQYDEALDMQKKSLVVKQEINDRYGIATTYNNIGILYKVKREYGQALENYSLSLKIMQELKDVQGTAYILENIASVYMNQAIETKTFDNKTAGAKMKQALETFFVSLKLKEEIKDMEGIITSYINIGELYSKNNNRAEAEIYLSKALKLSLEMGSRSAEMDCYNVLTDMDTTFGLYQKGLSDYIHYVACKDSLLSEENTRHSVQVKMQYEFDKKEAAIKAEQERKNALAEAESQRHKVIILFVTGFSVLLLILAVVIFRNLRLNQKKNRIIQMQKEAVEKQKQLVEEKQKEIVDSITYAQRLQQAILPPSELIKSHLPESFVLYLPKDIVAGDFYWAEASGTDFYIAAADCTGHGVPGAMVSLVCSNALNRSVKEFALTATGDVLDKSRELVIETFEKSLAEVKDGMDISLLRISKAEGCTTIEWSGANNSLLYLEGGNLHEIKADKQPIGKYSEAVQFTTHRPMVSGPVTFYLYTDGYADQFSEAGKKLMKKKFKDILTSVHHLPAEEQKSRLEKILHEWKGSAEQTDDVLVLGFRVNL